MAKRQTKSPPKRQTKAAKPRAGFEGLGLASQRLRKRVNFRQGAAFARSDSKPEDTDK